MSQKKVIIFSYYFGKLPEWFPFFLKSAAYNSTIDFVIVTDDQTNFEYPSNVSVVFSSFSEAKDRIQALFFDLSIVLDRPYKLCDYKPVWGLAFPERLEGYDFWGYCDLDMIFGDIRSFVTDEVLDQYEKIYQLGHLTLYRNNEISNSRYRLSAVNAVSYKDAFTTPDIVAFDEIAGMQNIYDSNKIATYKSRDYADITWGRVRFTLSDFLLSEEQILNNNYDKQLFYWDDGHIYRAFLDGNVIKTDEFVYIHFSKRKMVPNNTSLDCNSFYITNRGLYGKSEETKRSDFDTFNPYEPLKEKERRKEVLKNGRREKANYYLKIIKRKLGLK